MNAADEERPNELERPLLSENDATRVQAHQFTINGMTHPFVRDHHFAALLDPPERRRYDMPPGLHPAKPGDVVFFFQADPQRKNSGMEGWGASEASTRRSTSRSRTRCR
jgi:hypothetical protein